MIIIYIYLLYENPFQPRPGRHASTPRKEKREEKKRKGIEAHRVKRPTPSQATDALIGNEEQNGKQRKGSRHRGQLNC